MLVSMYKIKKRYANLADISDPVATRMEPKCAYRLLNILLSDRFAASLSQLENVAEPGEIDAGKVANKFWEGMQEHSKAKTKCTTTCTLRMMRFLVNYLILTSRK